MATSVKAARDLQVHLEAEWQRAEAYLDTGKPLTKRFWANMEKFYEAMDELDEAERLARLAGRGECLCGFATCRACLTGLPRKTPSQNPAV